MILASACANSIECLNKYKTHVIVNNSSNNDLFCFCFVQICFDSFNDENTYKLLTCKMVL